MKIIEKNIKDITPYENNPRNNEDAVEKVAESIKEFGFQQPIVVDKDNVVIVGHTRLKAAERLGLDKVPVVVADELTEEQAKAYRIADNKTNEIATWKFDVLNKELLDIGQIDMSKFGFDMSALADDLVAEEDDYVLDGNIVTKVKQGDLWKLGGHRLICGDSTDITVIDRLMDGVKADMVMTDAPYGVSAVNSEGTVIGYGENHLAERGKYAPIIGDDTTKTAQQAYDLLSQICDKLILWGGNYFLDFLPASDGWLIWDKRGESGIRNNFADGEMAWCSFHTPVRIYHQLWNGMIREGEHEKRVHPTQKPIKMLSEILQDFSKENEVILDVFGGSGSTLIACEQLNRKCYMCELDPHYCSVIIDRWESLTGQKAIKING